MTDSEGINADLAGGSTACYADRKPNFCALCGSTQLLLGAYGCSATGIKA